MSPGTTVKNKSSASKLGKRSAKSAETDEMEEWKKSKQLLKPKDQLELSDAELREIVEKQLSTANPQIPDSLIEFSFSQGEFIPIPPPGNLIMVYRSEGTLLYKDSQEARKQLIEEGINPDTYFEKGSDDEGEDETEEIVEDQVEEEETEEGGATAEGEAEEREEGAETPPPAEKTEEGGEGGEEVEEGEREDHEKETVKKAPSKMQARGKKARKLINSFNFCERAALTYNNPTRTQETQTIPPPMANFSSNVLQWIIYDAYQKDWEQQLREKELERERKEREKAPVGRTVAIKKVVGKKLSEIIQGRMFDCWRVLERMVNLNTYDDIAKDFRYWDDPADEFREQEGTILPLWKFAYSKTKKHAVTDLMWNPYYYDLFVVGFGHMDFTGPLSWGAVCLYTLKNPSFPDYICLTSSSVICVDTHPKYPYMILLGLYDGSIEIFNIQVTCKEPAYRSNNVTDKHRGIVWEVKWVPDLPDGELNFYSVSIDGKVNHWVLLDNTLCVTTIIVLHLDKAPVPGPDGTLMKTKSSASCLKFHPKDPTIFLVGTEEGLIYKCSTEYSSAYLLTYKAHQMPVYRIDFNRYNTDIFISCGSDWRIKIWEDNRLEPLFVFDVGDRIGDVKFAPYSSTVFAAVTREGKVCVFDLNINKYKPICVQAIVSKKRNRTTRLNFNPRMPIIIVGDDSGNVATLKLSPNLRIPCKAPKKQQHLDQWTLQCMKLEKILALVREPVTLTLPPDVPEDDD